MLDKRLRKIVKELYAIPNAPYSLKLRSEYIKLKIKDAGLEYKETPYYISAKLNHGEDRRKKILFISHLDHPGFVFKDSKEGIAFGSLYLDRLKNLKPLNIYSPEGKYLGDAEISKVYGRDESKVLINADFNIPKNSQGLWDVGDVTFDEINISGRSHDNDIATAILLNNMKRIESHDFDIIFLFTKHEEVLQQSSFHISKKNSLKLTGEDIVINLESMKVYPTTDDPQYSSLGYENGLVLNVSETTCIYSSKGDISNLSESLINNIVEGTGLNIQRGMAGGTSDARPLAIHGLTNNLVTLNVPNEFKHNSDGINVTAERVKIHDVISVDIIIRSILETPTLPLEPNSKDISKDIVKIYPNFNTQTSQSYIRINSRLDYAFRDVVKRGYYFPQSILDTLRDLYWKVISYIDYFVSGKGTNSTVSKE
ncbi:hypothetical protein HYV12_03185 [Candidatus Dojkabacteria bacterium]|nr:hypothetical protein [Candidatus Dojkabacteria bacterium]